MGCAFLGQSRIETHLLQSLACGVARQRPVRSCPRKQPQPRFFLAPIGTQDFEQFHRQQREPLLASLGVTHVHNHLLGIDILNTQVASFVNAQSGGVTRHEQGTILWAPKSLEQGSQLIGMQHHRQRPLLLPRKG